MIGKIDKKGELHIKRGNKFVKSVCHLATSYRVNNERWGLSCGGCCPLFGEPEKVDKSHYLYETSNVKNIIILPLCYRTLEFDKLKDERKKQ
jgi:hypothetical protein